MAGCCSAYTHTDMGATASVHQMCYPDACHAPMSPCDQELLLQGHLLLKSITQTMPQDYIHTVTGGGVNQPPLVMAPGYAAGLGFYVR